MKFPNNPMFPMKTFEEVLEEHTSDEVLSDAPRIPEFFAGQDVFITGGTGFIGKALVEKLLRSCAEIGTIFLLMRPKRGKNIDERLEEILENPLFDILRKINPNFQEKLKPIIGDVSELGLKMSEKDIEKVKNVSVIFHSAASVRFDDSLKYAVLMNTRGTREVMEFALKLNNLKSVVHVSTTYSNVFVHKTEEKIYPAAADWRKTIEVCEKFDGDQLDVLTQHYISFMPNTYVFSKNLAEHVSDYYKSKLPVIVFRPSVVVGAVKDPLPGWVDNINGPMGILLASVLGISKTMHIDPENRLDMIPIDICSKAIVVAAWKNVFKPSDSMTVYNCASGGKIGFTTKQLLDIGITSTCKEFAMDHMIWKANGGVTACKAYNNIRTLFFQILPALLIDFALKLQQKEPRLMKIQRKMYEANKALTYFGLNSWDFQNENFIKLCRCLRLEDVRQFDFKDSLFFDRIQYVRDTVLGYRRYLLKEEDETLERCRKKYERFELANEIVIKIPHCIAIYVLFFKFDILNVLKNQLGC